MDSLDKSLTEEDLQLVDRYLRRVVGGAIPNVERLDGFMTALAICPDLVMPSEYFKVITKGKTAKDDLVFETPEDAEAFFGLILRHWNTINNTYRKGDIYFPILAENDEEQTEGNDWAKGFLTGMQLRHEVWHDVVNDDRHGGHFVYIWALAYEHDDDPDLRPFTEPVTPEKRKDLIAGMIAGARHLYDYFEADRKLWSEARTERQPYRRSTAKVGRNEPCPCGSGQKYKTCCGRVTIH